MTSIRDRILARYDLAAARSMRDIDALAMGLNAQPEYAVGPRFVTARTILAECAEGAALLDALETAAQQISAVKWALNFLGKDSGLDVGNPATQAMIDQLVAVSALTTGQAADLKKMALQPVMVTREQVAEAMYNLDGSEK